MTFLSTPAAAHFLRKAMPYAVALLGLLTTGWLAREVAVSDRDRLEQRFQREAHEQAEAVIRPFADQLAVFEVLQRVFHTVSEIDEATFARILDPLSRRPGLRGFTWAPIVEAEDRDDFERLGKKRWGEAFSITQFDLDGNKAQRERQDRYLPVLFRLPMNGRQHVIGLDLYSLPGRRPLIDSAIEEGSPQSSGLVPSLTTPNAKASVVLFYAPVYRAGRVPLLREERRNTIAGMLTTAVDVGELLDVTMASSRSDLHVSLFDFEAPDRAIRHWPAASSESHGKGTLRLSRNFELADHVWTVRVEADQAWMDANASGREKGVALVGVILTILLFLSLRRLIGRSALADELESTHDTIVQQQRAAEDRARKLSMVVEQNPATIFITDLQGCIEYVNDMFVQTSGYPRSEAVGMLATRLAVETEGHAAYREMHEAIRAGMAWQGELPSRRRDGHIYWERVLMAPVKDDEGSITNYMAIKEDISELRDLMSQLQESENRFRSAMSAMAEGLAVLSSDGTCFFANRAAERILGYPENGLQSGNVRQLPMQFLDIREQPIPNPLENSEIMLSLCRERELRNRVVGLRFPDGALRWLEVSTSPLLGAEGQEPRVVLTFSDITERRSADEKSRLAFEAIRHSGEGILVTDAAHRIVSVNPAFESVTGYRASEVVGKTPEIFSSVTQDDSFFDGLQEILESSGNWRGEVWNRRKNGEVYPEWLGVSAVREADGKARYYVYIFSDMTERKAAQERIEFLAHHDPLTELPNRLLLRDRMAQAMAQATRLKSRVALMFLDLDRFKKINDSLGHPVGDALLKAIVERLKSCVRESDTISRQGGDEFIIVLNDVRDSDAVSRVADKIHQRMGQPFSIGEHSLSSSFSMGVALFPDDGEDFDILMQKADTAMYHAKEAGRNSHRFFTEQMNLQVVEHMNLETQLRRALENNEFVLHYQPQLDLQERTIVGVEALVRWNSPDNGLVPPGKFIPVAEDSGLIVQIGAWVLREACRQARAWQDAGLPPFVMAVNLSAIQFKRLDLVNTVINALVLSDLDSQWLELELTESILLQDAEATLDTVHRLKALGVKLSVDDFGTGYSSLAYLKRFAVDKLKIDQSFVRDLVTDPDDAAIVRAIIQMAHSLKLKTIAEGVETEELCNLLQLFRCDEIQGYWLARPMPAQELEDFVREFDAGSTAR